MRAHLLTEPTRTLAAEELGKLGVLYWNLPVDASENELARIKRERGYVEQDEVSLSNATPNLEAICAKFDQEHSHTLDEVRFVVEGEGIFDVRDESDQWVRIHVEAGDLIIIPAHKHHRFYLTESKAIRCVRLFLNNEGWAPLYRETTNA
jgi:1,2-dihydroxy-3-keto-5-methylthiopentene dioxygenase